MFLESNNNIFRISLKGIATQASPESQNSADSALYWLLFFSIIKFEKSIQCRVGTVLTITAQNPAKFEKYRPKTSLAHVWQASLFKLLEKSFLV